MKFEKKGLIFKADKETYWWKSHTQSPVCLLMGEKIRIFLGCIGEDDIVRIGYIDVKADNPKEILKVSQTPLLDLGEPGMFDDNGVFPASAVMHNNKIYLYYTGFQECKKIRYCMFGGLAISEDNGKIFNRVSQSPITDRSDEGLFFRGGPSVLFEDNKFKVFYSAGSDWIEAGGKLLRPCYNIFHAESTDGINFPTKGTQCLSYSSEKGEHGIGRPLIKKIGEKYRLFFCVRKLDMKYSMGYAESEDCINWTRADEKMDMHHSNEGWDSEMIYFPSVLEYGEKAYMFYSGNNYGEGGLGYAECLNFS